MLLTSDLLTSPFVQYKLAMTPRIITIDFATMIFSWRNFKRLNQLEELTNFTWAPPPVEEILERRRRGLPRLGYMFGRLVAGSTPVPLMQISRESRKEVLRMYNFAVDASRSNELIEGKLQGILKKTFALPVTQL